MHVWVPSIGISGAMFYTGDRFPGWKGNLFVGGMVGEQVGRVAIAGDKVLSRETLLPGVGRVRDMRQGPDGFIYLVTEDEDGKPTPVVRLEPVERTTSRVGRRTETRHDGPADAGARDLPPSASPPPRSIGAAQALDAAGLDAQIGRIFEDHAYDPPRFGPARWLPDGSAYAIVERNANGGSDIVRYDAASGERRVLVDGARLVPPGQKSGLVIDDYEWSADSSQAPHLHQHREGVAAEHARRLLGARDRVGQADAARRQGAGLDADVRQVLTRCHPRGLRARQRPVRRAARPTAGSRG